MGTARIIVVIIGGWCHAGGGGEDAAFGGGGITVGGIVGHVCVLIVSVFEQEIRGAPLLPLHCCPVVLFFLSVLWAQKIIIRRRRLAKQNNNNNLQKLTALFSIAFMYVSTCVQFTDYL